MGSASVNNFATAKKLIDEYQDHFPILSRYELVKNFLENYKNSELFINTVRRNKERFTAVERLIEGYKNTNLFLKAQRYDLFRELKLKLSENEISDIIADVLNPQKLPFGKFILTSLLRNTGKERIASILERTDARHISVKREQSGDSSRIDIRITTKNISSENAVIDLEMKVKNGSETSHKNGKPQTIREWQDLDKFASESGIPIKNIVAYFITPEGNKAQSENFVSIARYKLNEMILKGLVNLCQCKEIDNDSICTLRHFFSSGWLF